MILSLNRKWNRFEHSVLGLQLLSLLLQYKRIIDYGEKETMILINILWFSEDFTRAKKSAISLNDQDVPVFPIRGTVL